MRIMITGGDGLLGRALAQGLAGWAAAGGHHVDAVNHDECDVTDGRLVSRAFRDHQPDVVLHCAAVSSPARCEANRELAFSVNDLGSATMAHACRVHGARLFFFSTARVFGGEDKAHDEFARVEKAADAYGQSKWGGECAIRLCCADHVILRLSWLYAAGGDDFLHALLRVAREGEGPITVPIDRMGSPASGDAVAHAVSALLDRRDLVGTYHVGGGGETSLFGFARAALELAGIGRQVAPGMAGSATAGLVVPDSARLTNRLLAIRGLPPMPGWREDLAAFMAREFAKGAA